MNLEIADIILKVSKRKLNHLKKRKKLGLEKSYSSFEINQQQKLTNQIEIITDGFMNKCGRLTNIEENDQMMHMYKNHPNICKKK